MRCCAVLLILATCAVTSANTFHSHTAFKLSDDINKNIQQRLNEKIRVKTTYDDLLKQDANTFIDQVLQMIDEIIQAEHLDPLEVISIDLFGVHVEVWVGGYSSLVRAGNASVIQSDETTSITTSVAIHNLAANISASTSIIGIPINIGGSGNIDTVSIKLALRFVKDPSTGAVSGYVDDLQVYDIGTITVTVFGLGPFDYLADVIADVVANMLKYFVPFFIDGILKVILQQIIDTIFH